MLKRIKYKGVITLLLILSFLYAAASIIFVGQVRGVSFLSELLHNPFTNIAVFVALANLIYLKINEIANSDIKRVAVKRIYILTESILLLYFLLCIFFRRSGYANYGSFRRQIEDAYLRNDIIEMQLALYVVCILLYLFKVSETQNISSEN